MKALPDATGSDTSFSEQLLTSLAGEEAPQKRSLPRETVAEDEPEEGLYGGGWRVAPKRPGHHHFTVVAPSGYVRAAVPDLTRARELARQFNAEPM